MSETPPPPLRDAVIEQAIDWSIRLGYNQPGEEAYKAFSSWLADADEHRVAWERIQSLGGRFAGLPSKLAMQTLEKLPDARLKRRRIIKLLALFGAVGTCTWGTAEITPWQRLVADRSTRTGERRRWTLADGSVLDLNTDSAVSLHFDDTQRLVQLLRGELHLISGADAGSQVPRPLRVKTPFALLEALNARFSVRLKEHVCRLDVTEGAVRVQPQTGPGEMARPGEVWLLSAEGATQSAGGSQDIAAWREGLLVARDMPLSRVLDELGRHRHGHLGCDPQIANRPISGNFSLADTDTTLVFLAEAHGLRLHHLTRYWVRLST